MHAGSRVIELVLLGHKVIRGQHAWPLDKNSTPLLRHLPKLGQQLLLLFLAPRARREKRERHESLSEPSPLSDIRLALEFDPAKTLEHRVHWDQRDRAVGQKREVHTCTIDLLRKPGLPFMPPAVA